MGSAAKPGGPHVDMDEMPGQARHDRKGHFLSSKGTAAPLDSFRARPKSESTGIAAAKGTRWMNCAARVGEMRYNSIGCAMG